MQGKKAPLAPIGGPLVASDPSVPLKNPDRPADLHGYAAEAWDLATVAQTFPDHCVPLLVAFCLQYGVFRESMDEVEREGIVTKNRQLRRSNPWLVAANNAFDRMTKLGIDLGLVPSRMGRPPKAGREPAASAKFVKRAA
jgi:phage terminase small subunit